MSRPKHYLTIQRLNRREKADRLEEKNMTILHLEWNRQGTGRMDQARNEEWTKLLPCFIDGTIHIPPIKKVYSKPVSIERNGVA